MFFAETVYVNAAPLLEWLLPMAATLAGMFSVAYSLRFTVDVFWGPAASALPRHPHEPPHWIRVPVELLVLACLVVGMLPAWSVGAALEAAARPVVGGVLPSYSLVVWHGFNTPFVMSLVALAGGVALYALLRWPSPPHGPTRHPWRSAAAASGCSPEPWRSSPKRAAGGAACWAPGACNGKWCGWWWRRWWRAWCRSRSGGCPSARACCCRCRPPLPCCGCWALPAPWLRPGRPSTTAWRR